VFGESNNPGIIPFSLKELFQVIDAQKADVICSLIITTANISASTLIACRLIPSTGMALLCTREI